MIYHDISWWIMVNQIWYTPTLIRFWLPSPSLAHWNWHHIKVLAELVGSPAAPSRLGENPVRKCSPGRSGIHRNGWKIIRNWWHMVNYGDMVMQCIRNHCTKNWLWILSNAPVDRSNSGTTWLLELIQSLGRPSDAKSLGGPPWSPWFGRGHGQHESNSASNHNKPHEGELDELWAHTSHSETIFAIAKDIKRLYPPRKHRRKELFSPPWDQFLWLGIWESHHGRPKLPPSIRKFIVETQIGWYHWWFFGGSICSKGFRSKTAQKPCSCCSSLRIFKGPNIASMNPANCSSLFSSCTSQSGGLNSTTPWKGIETRC